MFFATIQICRVWKKCWVKCCAGDPFYWVGNRWNFVFFVIVVVYIFMYLHIFNLFLYLYMSHIFKIRVFKLMCAFTKSIWFFSFFGNLLIPMLAVSLRVEYEKSSVNLRIVTAVNITNMHLKTRRFWKDKIWTSFLQSHQISV